MINVRLADVVIALDNLFPDLEVLCRDYITEEPAVMVFRVTPEELEAERQNQAQEFSDGYLETVCMYRKLALEMTRHNVFIMHASVIEVDGEGYAFLAPSGTGKTTQTRLWMGYFGSRARAINGDKPLIRMLPDGDGWKFLAYGTPWCGKEGMGCNASVPLKALFLLERAEEPSCTAASEEYRIDRIFRQLLLPERMDQMDALLTMADRLIETVPAYLLRCNMGTESVEAAFASARRGSAGS